MFYYTLGAFVTLLSFILYKITLSILNTKKNNQEATRRGCLPPPTLPSTNLLKTSILKESIKANKEDRGPQYILNAMNSLSPNIHTVRVPVLNYELLVTRDPENLKAMLSTQSSDFDISNTRSAAFMPLLGQGIFTATGTNWKHSRALVRPQFSHEEISNLELVDRHVNILLKRLEVDGDGWTEKLDMQPMFQNFALDTATEFLYGQSVNSQTVDKDPGSVGDGINGAVFGKYLDAAKLYVDKRGALAKLYWLLSWSKAAKEFQVHCQEIQKIAGRLVEERLDYLRNNKELEKGAPGRKFVLLDELAKSTQNLLELRNETLHVLMAGRDPTGSLIGWVFYMLARNPTICQKLRHTILEHFGSISGSEIDFKQLRNCQYLQYVINETIRFIAIIPMNERTALNDTTLPRGGGPNGTSPIFVPKGNQVLIPFYAMQHRPDLWGADADVFNPERWEGRKIGWEFVPFGGGPRKCLGQQFAYNEASYLIVRFLQRFDAVENMEGSGPIRLHTAIENRSGTGVQVRFHKARSNFE